MTVSEIVYKDAKVPPKTTKQLKTQHPIIPETLMMKCYPRRSQITQNLYKLLSMLLMINVDWSLGLWWYVICVVSVRQRADTKPAARPPSTQLYTMSTHINKAISPTYIYSDNHKNGITNTTNDIFNMFLKNQPTMATKFI